MSIESKITELLEQAAPLRLLAEDDEAKLPLGGMVDAINALRARQAKGEEDAPEEGKPKRGRPANPTKHEAE